MSAKTKWSNTKLNTYLDHKVNNVADTTYTSVNAVDSIWDPKLKFSQHSIVVRGIVACLAKDL